MIYSKNHLNETEYKQITTNYYIPMEEWCVINRKVTRNEEIHLALCNCINARRKGLVFTGQSFCAIHGVPRLNPYETRPHCLTDKKKGTDLIHWHRNEKDSATKTTTMNGLTTVNPIQAIFDIAKMDSPDSILTSMNHCLSKRMFTDAQLHDVIENQPGRKGRNLLKRLLRHATKKCESPLETLGYIAIYKAGFVMPEQQIRIFDRYRYPVARVDMYWKLPNKEIILELDGDEKYLVDPKSFRKEKHREYELRELGYEVIRSDYEEIKNGKLLQKLITCGIPLRRHFKGTFPTK
ncbi:MAG: endonuclease domain-containing protein [Clostridiales Family XIII bacterium]|jgi:very-short-patch-repair endonuclease|nr:endonuclease domain-containing protein [Clostridiales Family XIII bacterium]